MKKILKIATFLNVVVFTVAILGCASFGSKNANVIIENGSTPRANLNNIIVTRDKSNVAVVGTLKTSRRSFSPGHIQITFVSINGDVLQTVETDYRTHGRKSRKHYFRVDVPIDLPDGSTVRLIHHRQVHEESS